MAVTIDELEIDIQATSTAASKGIDSLITSLTGLRTASKGGAGLTTVKKQLEALSGVVQNMIDPTQKIAGLVAALKPLETIGKSNLGSALNQLKKIPEITAGLDDAKLSAFAAKITQVTAAVRPLATEMEKVSLGFSRLPANIQKAINANARLTRSNKTTAFGFNMLAAKISIVYVAMRRVASVIGGWIKESNDYVENLNLFTVAMGDGAEEAQRFAEHVGAALGIDPSEWMRNQGIFNTLLTGFGVVSDKAALMSKNLTQLGYDLGSFFNISFADAMQKLQSGISGELEPLRRLGYDLSQAKLEAIALANGIDISVSSMTQAQKAQLRYYAIMTQVTTAQGDMARTLEAPANQLRILTAQATQAARALGNIFIPALNAVLPYAIAFLKIIRLVADSLASLFGFSLPQIDYSGVSGLASGAEDAADALGDAADNAKKLKGLLAGFDELNIIQQDTSGAGGSGAVGGDLGLKLPEYDFLGGLIDSKVADIFEGWKAKIVPIFDWVKDNFDIIKGAAIGVGIALLGWKLGGGLTGSIGTLLGKLKTIAEAVLIVAGSAALVGGAFDAWENGVDWQNLLLMVGGVAAIVAGLALSAHPLIAIIGAIIGGLTILTVSFKDAWENGSTAMNRLGIAIGSALTGGLGMLAQVVIGVKNHWDEISAFFSTGIENIKAVAIGIAGWFNDNVLQPIINFFRPAVEWIGTLFQGCWIFIQAVWSIASKWFSEKVVQPIAGFFKGLWTDVSNVFKQLWMDIKKVWEPVAGWFNNTIIKPLVKAFTTAWDGIRGAFEIAFNAIANFAKSIFNGVIGQVESVINSVISGINALISSFNRVVTWAADVIGTNWKGLSVIQTISLPRYEYGGFPENGLFLANSTELVGQFSNGRTAVANNEQIVDGIAGGVERANAEQNALLREQNRLLRALLEKESGPVFAPSVEAGRWAARSVGLYDAARGTT
jgi:hypothetical protein